MRKLLIAFVGIITLTTPVSAESQPLLSATFVEVENGKIAENTLLASDDSSLFIEFSKDSRFISAEEKTNFTGEILPPQIIELDVKNPRDLLRELVTFELVASTGNDIAFIDEYDSRTRKDLYRENLKNPQDLNRSAWVKLIFPIDVNLANLPKLWEWQGEEYGWKRLGGTFQELENKTEENKNIKVFNTIIRRTGIYSVFDEDPPPLHFADEYELHPPNYVEPNMQNNNDSSLSQKDLGFANDYQFEDNLNQDFANFEPESRAEEIPNSNESEDSKYLEKLQENINNNKSVLEKNPKIQEKVDNLVSLVTKKIKNDEETIKTTSELDTISKALNQAETAEERTNLEETFLSMQSNLYKLNEEKPDENQILILQKEVDDFFVGVTLAKTIDNPKEEIDRSPPKDDINSKLEKDIVVKTTKETYIPENVELPKSGGEEQKISLAFPLFLLFCFGLLGFTIFSNKKES